MQFNSKLHNSQLISQILIMAHGGTSVTFWQFLSRYSNNAVCNIRYATVNSFTAVQPGQCTTSEERLCD